MKNIYLFELSDVFANQVYLPYCSGVVWSYVKNNPYIKDTFNELDIGNYRTFFKLKPPLRSNSDREALVDAIKDGTIDNICSMHTPQDEESKRLPYEEAAFGAVGLETILPASLSLYHNKDLELYQLFQLLSLNPAKILKKNLGTLEKDSPADLIIFDLNKPIKVDRFKFKSKSQNTPHMVIFLLL